MRLDLSFLLGVWLEAVVYGIYFVAFAVCLRLFRTRAPPVGRALPIWLVGLFALATAHCGLSLSALLDAFVRHTYPSNGPSTPTPSPYLGPDGVPRPNPNTGPARLPNANDYIANRALPMNLASLGVYSAIVFVSDLMLLYRLLVMYRYKFAWTVGPAILSVASFAISMVVVSRYSAIDLGAPKNVILTQLEAVDPWVPPIYAVSFLASLAITALMMIKTSFASTPIKALPAFATRRRRRQTSAGDGFAFDMDARTGPLPPAPEPHPVVSPKWVMLAGIVESGALAPVFMLAALILYVAQGGEETLLVPLLAPLSALVPTLQILQIQLGLDSTSRLAQPVPSRSPYMVPAPRYRDSFSSDEDKTDLVNTRAGDRERPNGARRFSARGMWAWRGSAGSGSGSHSHSNSQSSGRADHPVAVQMRDLTGHGRAVSGADAKQPVADTDAEGIWERVKLDESEQSARARKSTLRKSVAKEMISKPIPVAADFPPSTIGIPSTHVPPVPALPSFTITNGQGVTRATSNVGANMGRSSTGSLKAGGEHKYHYKMRPREKTASPLAAYLSAQAQAQHEPPFGHPNASSGHLPASQAPMSLPSTVPTSPASGSTSLAPASRNPFRYDAATPPPQPQPQHKRSYSDVRRGDAPAEQTAGMAGIGLAGAHRSAITFPFSPDPEADSVPRWAAITGAPRIPGLDPFGPQGPERDVSPAPGLQRDYALAREEALRQMQHARGGGMSDDESVYSTQLLNGPRGAGWKGFNDAR